LFWARTGNGIVRNANNIKMIERKLDLELNDFSAILLSLLNFTTPLFIALVSLRMWRLTLSESVPFDGRHRGITGLGGDVEDRLTKAITVDQRSWLWISGFRVPWHT
jgi:hypothetical protein